MVRRSEHSHTPPSLHTHTHTYVCSTHRRCPMMVMAMGAWFGCAMHSRVSVHLYAQYVVSAGVRREKSMAAFFVVAVVGVCVCLLLRARQLFSLDFAFVIERAKGMAFRGWVRQLSAYVLRGRFLTAGQEFACMYAAYAEYGGGWNCSPSNDPTMKRPHYHRRRWQTPNVQCYNYRFIEMRAHTNSYAPAAARAFMLLCCVRHITGSTYSTPPPCEIYFSECISGELRRARRINIYMALAYALS